MATPPIRDTLFLAAPGFYAGEDGPFYCNDCVPVEGFLSLFPQVRDGIDVQHIDVKRPRAPVVAWLGDDHQSLPTLVLAESDSGDFKTVNGIAYINDQTEIRSYLSKTYGVASQA